MTPAKARAEMELMEAAPVKIGEPVGPAAEPVPEADPVPAGEPVPR